ncbi:MAG TPA: ribonuclease P protein component [Turneriella sp.]|nr:ribonuclease P protein component [Turneriella sp.]
MHPHGLSGVNPPQAYKGRASLFIPLKSKKRIAALFKVGKKIYASQFLLRYLPTPTTEVDSVVNPPLSVVFAVSHKLGKAHQRNRIKRRLREALAIAVDFHSWRQKKKYDLAILPRVDVATMPFDALVQDLKHALKRL